MSHEIRTPLNAVNMGLNIIKREIQLNNNGKRIDLDDILSLVEEIESANNTSTNILNDLLIYEKIDAGVLILEKEVVTAFPIIYDCVRPFLLHVCRIYIYIFTFIYIYNIYNYFKIYFKYNQYVHITIYV